MKKLLITYLIKKNLVILFVGMAFISSQSFGQETPKLTDPQIAHVGVIANQIDIDIAEIAQKKSKNEDVINFANTMVLDHSAVIKQATDLVTKLGVTPEDNAVSQSLLSDAAQTKKMLKSKKGKEFDKAYIENEISYHKAVIAAVRDLLVPQSKNAELKKLLEGILPALEAHLTHVEGLKSKI